MRYRKHEEHGFRAPSRKFEFCSTVMEHASRPPLPVYAAPPDYRWKELSVNLLIGDDRFDPDFKAELLKCYVCRIKPA